MTLTISTAGKIVRPSATRMKNARSGPGIIHFINVTQSQEILLMSER